VNLIPEFAILLRVGEQHPADRGAPAGGVLLRAAQQGPHGEECLGECPRLF
jgi:hypothetical protein